MDKITPLHQIHISMGARMVAFAGYQMPIHYSGLVEEHWAVRRAAGLFDVSHMGNILVSGEGSFEFLQNITVGDLSKIPVLGVQYSAVCKEDGCPLDDILVTYLQPQAYHLVVNASNVDRVWAWLKENAPSSLLLQNQTQELAILALQGPQALSIAQQISDQDLSKIERYHAGHGKIAGIDMVYSRTGYTGEDGFEFFPKNKDALVLWNSLMEAGKGRGLLPCGLGARDSLRLEAGYSLYGHEIDEQTNLVESGLSWIIGWDKENFIGKNALVQAKSQGTGRKLMGISLVDKAIPRQGYPIYHKDQQVGYVTSGTQSPVTGNGIGLALVSSHLGIETEVHLDVRGQKKLARLCSRTHYKFAQGVF